ncbi:SRPBCC domain-containing protein [Flavobacterium tructae]|uniref:SRPBCC domain-containing protein n=1 Tax=Flavobacterium tructae TaxID=1114873 RepID=UPI0025520208|nr:SRPBCC domain-containing protein [Flavobacterium tructae]MDL2142462.1 SRPBCC domain-containing protein [Flavobacterium tructae]
MITVQNIIKEAIDKVWEFWTTPEHIVKWNFPSEDWHTIQVENDLRVDGKFKYTMAAKDGTATFDFEGVYTRVETFSEIEYQLSDNRTGSVHFKESDEKVILTEIFQPETENPEEMQQQWCQAVIDCFKEYVENN